jgi:hypothetical protein
MRVMLLQLERLKLWPLGSDPTAKVQGEFVAQILLGGATDLC